MSQLISFLFFKKQEVTHRKKILQLCIFDSHTEMDIRVCVRRICASA